jgi:DNA ligase (NAD+)
MYHLIMSEERIVQLRGTLRNARKAYYNLSPIISDQEYDALKDELKQLSPDDPEIKAVGAKPLTHTVWDKVKHEIPMGSLDKVNSTDEFIKWVQGTGIISIASGLTNEYLFVTHKIDGSSLEVIYDQGKLIRCVSRGSGVIGEDITTNAIQIPNLPKEIPITERVIVRGEVVMFKNVFKQKYAEQYANPRNTAAGKIRDKRTGGKDCQDLSFLAFTLMSPTAPDSEEQRFKALLAMGFTVPDWFTGHLDGAIKWHKTNADNREQIPYEIDGTVARVGIVSIQEELGELNMRPRGQIAWKFDPAMGVTMVKDIVWQVGNTGRITGVAQLHPINIGGVVITRVSLHNLKIFKDLKLWKDCEVLVSRRNDCIPYIEDNLSLTRLRKDGVDI